MASKGTIIGLVILGIVLVLVIAIVIGLWYVGLFATPEIALEQKGPYYYVYIDRTGPFTEVPKAHQEAASLAEQQKIEIGIACAVYFDNPAEVAQENLRWRAGYIVKDSVETIEPLLFKMIPNQEYLIASIKALPMVAPIKTYPAIHEWLGKNPYDIDGESLELYNENGVVEVLFPVKKHVE